jgi:hypothetical protein
MWLILMGRNNVFVIFSMIFNIEKVIWILNHQGWMNMFQHLFNVIITKQTTVVAMLHHIWL